MAFNNFPLGYQPAQIVYPQAQPENKGGMIWVQGEASAKSYLVAPNQSVTLWDSEQNTIYVKTADASGMPSMKVLDYTIRENAPISADSHAEQEFATKDDIDNLREEISSLRANIDDIANTKKEKK